MRKWLLGAVFVGLCGCAASPSTIEPTLVSRVPYAEMSCGNLEVQLQSEINNLATLSGEQISARSWDIALNLLIIPGIGALTGDNEEEIGQSKGRILVMQDVYSERCAADSN